MRHMPLGLTLLAVLAAAGAGACGTSRSHAAASPDLELAPCAPRGVQRRAECGTLRVPENRRAPGRTIALRLVVVRATDPGSRGAVFFLTGGPGSAATASAGPLTRELAALAGTHDFVFVDQRGTGASHPLACAAADPLAPLFDSAQAARCREALEDAADLRAYTTADAVADLDAVRDALGYDRINLHGSSYGTRVAWTYAADFPDRARTLVLHGPAPPGFVIPLPFAPGLEIALDGLIADCVGDPACAERFPRLKDDAAAAFERLRARSARVTLADGTASDLSQGELAEAVRYLLYSPVDARRLPLLLAQAAGGDYSPIARSAVTHRRGLARGIHMGMYLSVTCAEDIPLITDSAVASAAPRSLLGDYRVRQQMAACDAWPRGPAPSDRTSTLLRVPALLQVGVYDPATPLEWGRRAAALLPRGRLVIVPHGGHSFAGLGIDACLSEITTSFIRMGSAETVDDTCVAGASRPAFLLQ